MHKWGFGEAMGMPVEKGTHHRILKRFEVVFFEAVGWWILLLVAEQAVHLLAAQMGVRVQLVHNAIRHPLLVDL
jgi:hypothetical protein